MFEGANIKTQDFLFKNLEVYKIMTIIIIPLVIIYLLNLIDYFQTMYAIENFGIGIEANPTARFLIENDLGCLLKLIVMPIMLILVGVLVYKEKRMLWAIYLLLASFLVLVINNFIVLSQMGAF